ncbi:hypothetical protein C5167_041190 [Papaver somniferum]|uniref:DEAD/DEAH box helicase domain-containing protein n=1 Tax=Papaver somniferum TaxID=3469 RepID=A0A4Y7IKJ2_PAPSO|nr:hypothetical protein C5167_041190 [Papaver somniferum]
MKVAFGKSWKAELCEGKISEGKIDAGNPAVLVISTSALRALELLRGLRPLTKGCRAAKLFAKHMKVEEQVAMVKTRVNIASGTPSRIKNLIDMDALGLSRLDVIVLDMHTDTKGYSLLTLPQVSNEFWDLYKTHFEQPLIRDEAMHEELEHWIMRIKVLSINKSMRDGTIAILNLPKARANLK